jgi:hypothetical protein
MYFISGPKLFVLSIYSIMAQDGRWTILEEEAKKTTLEIADRSV